jgi:hypothetical protein
VGNLDCAEWRWIVAELKGALDGALLCLGIGLAVRRQARLEAARAARPLCDMDAERCALAASVVANRLDPRLSIEDFAEPLHRSLARALVTGQVTDDLAHGEVVGYLQGLLRDFDRKADPGPAVRRVAELARQRRALRIAEAACAGLRSADCHRALTAAELRSAAEVLEGCDVTW